MAGIAVPNDRTTRQPLRAFCRNPICRERSDKIFEFSPQHDRFCCPKCGANGEPMVGLYVLTHVLLRKPGGPIQGRFNQQYVIACDSKRAYLATATNLEAVTDNPSVANCPNCLEEIERQKVTAPTGVAVASPKKPVKNLYDGPIDWNFYSLKE